MDNRKEIILAYYGDDFTGSSDVLEVLNLWGIPTALFLATPEKDEVLDFKFKKPVDTLSNKIAFGVAGISRSLDPKAMEAELHPVLKKIKQIHFKYFHYKICSTLDSAPGVGNIGLAMDLAEAYFPSDFIPTVLGFPNLNRFVVFGHLFAKIKNKVYRLDRHPVMANHPITPMHESDVRMHLGQQTNRSMTLVDVLQLEKLEYLDPDSITENIPKGKRAPLVLFDTLETKQLEIIGKWIDRHALSQHQLLLGSSAIEHALGAVVGNYKENFFSSVAVCPLLIVSGSCSQTTADQITFVKDLGYSLIKIQVDLLFDPEKRPIEIDKIIKFALKSLKAGKHTVIYSALGPDDLLFREFPQSEEANPRPLQIAKAQAEITRKIIGLFPLQRLVTAGGDTSGYILKSLKIKALEFLNVLAPGAPLCIAHGEVIEVDGLEIAIKGGQNGSKEYFELARKGGKLV